MSDNARGSLYMTLGSIGYVVNDGLVRRATESGIGVYQALFLRTAAMAVLLGVIARARGEATGLARLGRPLVLRVTAEVAGAALFFAAVVRIEFANAQAILQLVPFAVTLVAALILRERVSAAQYATVLLGFAGVVLVIRPATDGFSSWSLLVVGAAAMLVVRDLATNRVPTTVPALSIAFVTALGLAALTGCIVVFTGWDAVDGRAALALTGSVICLIAGYLFTIETVRVGELSVSAPFRYTLLLGAVVVGYVLFDEVPDTPTIAGGLVIILSGIAAVLVGRRRDLQSGDGNVPPAATQRANTS